MTEKYYNEFKDLDLSLEELINQEHKLANDLSTIYHEMSVSIINNNKTTFDILNEKSIELHCKLSAIRILINQKRSDLG